MAAWKELRGSQAEGEAERAGPVLPPASALPWRECCSWRGSECGSLGGCTQQEACFHLQHPNQRGQEQPPSRGCSPHLQPDRPFRWSSDVVLNIPPCCRVGGGGVQRQPAAITAEPEQGNRTPAVTAARLQGRSLRGRAQPCEAQPDLLVLLC